jgi:hypothetical protein
MDDPTDANHSEGALSSPSDAFGDDANHREDPFPLSDDELLELAVICLIVDFGARNRALKPETDWWGGV